MEKIIINHADGSKIKLHQSKQYINISSAEQVTTLLNEDVVSIDLETSDKLDLYIGDSIVIYGAVYKMNQLPKVTKDGESKYTYSITFEGVQYDLMRAIYDLTIDTTNNQLQEVQADSLIGDLNRFATVLISNANRVMPGQWVLGEVPDTDSDINLTFSEDDNCLAVLQTLCKEFDTEFVITQSDGINTINFKKTGQIFPYTFRFGRGRGLYKIERTNVDTANIVTRLKVFGSKNNLGNKYRALRLCLPDKNKGNSYIEESPVLGYGVFENRKYFDDIEPQRTGVVGSVDSVLKFTDSTMFDLNEKDESGNTLYLITGVNAKIHFNSGNLAGFEFEMSKYDHDTHEFTIKQDSNDRGDSFPSNISEAYQFAIGNEYKIIDINMPDSYITDAENRLLVAAQDYYNENSQPKVSYSIAVTEQFIKRKYAASGSITNVFNIGDYLPIKDERIGVDKSVRIQSITRNLLKDYEYTLEVSDNVNTTILNRILDDVKDHEGVIKMNDLDNPARSRANWRTSRDTLNMVFDPEGDYYADKIKPESIDTMALSVGAKSMQFGLKDTVIQANYNGNKNAVFVKGGTLTHYSIEHGPWTLIDETITLTNDSAYYIYVKCSKSDNSGSISISQDKINVEGISGYYHFLIGILNSVDSDLKARAISLMYGFTTINGSYITTGKIKSHSGESYVDLDKNEFNLGDESSSLSFANKKLTLKGTLVQSNSGDKSAIGVFRGSYSRYITYYSGDEVVYTFGGKSSTYRYVNQTPTLGHTPTNTVYWSIKASSGSDGSPGTDGEGINDIFYLTNISDHTRIVVPKVSTEFPITPEFWFAEPQVMTSAKNYQYVSRRIKVNGAWGDFSEPTIWANYSNSITKIVEYYACNNSTTAPISGWTTIIPEVSLSNPYLWNKEVMSFTVQDDSETDPHIVLMYSKDGNDGIGIKSIQSKYILSYSTTAPGINDAGWSNTAPLMTATKKYLFNYDLITYTNDNTNTTTIRLIGIYGDKGTAGADGKSVELIFKQSNSAITISPDSINTDDYVPEGWTDNQKGVSSSNLYEYSCKRTKVNGVWSSFSTPPAVWANYSKDGKNGDNGKTGPSLIYRGNWDSSKTYYGTSDRRDCVKYNGLYYAALSYIESHFTTSTTPDLDTETWGVFGANFESVATNLLLAENANIAGFVYADGVMNSQEETDGKKNLLLNGVTGLLQALIGNIGDFKIENGDLKGYKDGKEVIQYTTDDLSSVEGSQSYNAINYTTDLGSSNSNSRTSQLSGDGEYYSDDTDSIENYIEFNLAAGCKIDIGGFFTANKSSGDVSVYLSSKTKIYKNGVLLIEKSSNDFTAILNDAGSYKLVITNTITAQHSSYEQFYWNGTIKYTLYRAKYSISSEKTIIASDGFMSIFGLANYFRFQNNEGLTVVVGNVGLKIGNGALKKTLDGNNWSNI